MTPELTLDFDIKCIKNIMKEQANFIISQIIAESLLHFICQ